MIQTIKKYWSVWLLVFAILFASATLVLGKKNTEGNLLLTKKAFAINNGWGYEILTNDSVYIHQANIPAVEGNRNFVTKEQALLTAQLVIEKLKKNQLPIISIEELDSLQIIK
jgi:hypothetical protein